MAEQQRSIPRNPRRRKRPPRVVSALAYFLLGACSTFAQRNNTSATLSDPDTRQLNLTSSTGVTFFLPAPSSNIPIYITLSLCAPPAAIQGNLSSTLPASLYVSNSTSITLPGPDTATSSDINAKRVVGLQKGFGNVTLPATDGAWIGVWAPNDADFGGSGTGAWSFELSVSTMSPSVMIDPRASYRFDDSDATNALLTTTNYSSSANVAATAPAYSAIVIPTTPLSSPLSSSMCFIQNQRALAASQVTASTTTRGFGGGPRVQFALSGLTPDTNYTSWLLEPVGTSTKLRDSTFFTTKTGSNCRLVYDVPFCPAVAYSVPSPPALSTTDLLAYYNTTVTPYVSAFARTLSTFPCDNIDMGGYSFISTCGTCQASYLDWICSVAMPRCTDPPSNATLDSSNSSTWTVPATTQQVLLRDNPAASRTPFFAPDELATNFPGLIRGVNTSAVETPFPYSEVPPCSDLCNHVAARCPPLIGWACPTKGGTGTAGYGLTQRVPAADRMGGDVRGGGGARAGDRFGNVYCNSLGSDLISAAQLHSAAAIALPSLPKISVAMLSIFILPLLI